MLNSPQLNHQKELSPIPSTENHQESYQYGRHLPTENITHITSYLDPETLLALATVSSAFHLHIQDDHTWHMAFVRNFLDVDPLVNLPTVNSILLRRTEPTWRKEYIYRYRIRRYVYPCVYPKISAYHI